MTSGQPNNFSLEVLLKGTIAGLVWRGKIIGNYSKAYCIPKNYIPSIDKTVLRLADPAALLATHVYSPA